MSSTKAGTEPSEIVESRKYRHLELFSFSLYAIGPLVGNAVFVLVGTIAIDFSIDPTSVLIAIPAFMFPYAIVQIFSGAISDIYGRVRVILLGSLSFAFGLFVTLNSASLEMFLWGNLLLGIGFGLVNPVILALLSDLSTPQSTPHRIGVAGALASFSAGLGPFIAGLLEPFGWEFYYTVFFFIVVIILIGVSVVSHPEREIHGNAEFHRFLVNLSAELRRPLVLLVLSATFLIALIYLGAIVWTSMALIGFLSESTIGLILFGAGIVGAAAGSLLSSMIRRWGLARPILFGLIPNFIGLFLFLMIGDVTAPSAVLFVALALIAIGWAGGLLYPMMITLGQIIAPTRHGVLAGIVTSSFFFGAAFVLQVFEPLFEIGIETVYFGMLTTSVILALVLYGLGRSLQSIQ